MNYLLLRPDKAGDALKTLPALRALLKYGPSGNYFVLGSPHNISLFSEEPGVVAFSDIGNLPKEFDRIVSLPCDLFETNDRLLRKFKGRKFSAGFFGANPPEQWHPLSLNGNTPAGKDERENIARLLGQAFDCDLVSRWREFSEVPRITESDKVEADRNLGPKNVCRLGFCPFAGLDHRTHPFDRWKKFIAKATQTNHFQEFFLFGTKNDEPPMQILKNSAADPRIVQLVFPSSFRALGAYFSRLDGIVAVDSGPLHLARAMDVPSLGFLSGGDVKRWFPRAGEGASLLPRGLFGRYPSTFEMTRAYRRWLGVFHEKTPI